MSNSKVLCCGDFRWDGIQLRPYKDEPGRYAGVTRQTLLGQGMGEEPLNFELRYFEVAPGGYSSLEHHQHPHAVVVVRGSGEVRLGAETIPIGLLDCVYVAPGTAHQFRATGSQPLGFLCVVDRERDRPVPGE